MYKIFSQVYFKDAHHITWSKGFIQNLNLEIFYLHLPGIDLFD